MFTFPGVVHWCNILPVCGRGPQSSNHCYLSVCYYTHCVPSVILSRPPWASFPKVCCQHTVSVSREHEAHSRDCGWVLTGDVLAAFREDVINVPAAQMLLCNSPFFFSWWQNQEDVWSRSVNTQKSGCRLVHSTLTSYWIQFGLLLSNGETLPVLSLKVAL